MAWSYKRELLGKDIKNQTGEEICSEKTEWVHYILTREVQCVTDVYLHCVATHVQDLGTVVQALLIDLRVRSQTQQVGVERHGYRMQRTFVDLCCQMALLLQAGFICLEAPEITHIHHLQQRSELREDTSIKDLALLDQVKALMSRICRLLFVNKTFTKLAPPPRLKAHTFVLVSRSYDLVTGRYVFIESNTSHPARCYWLGATSHCPKVDAQKRKIRKSRQRAGSLQIQTPPHTSSGS